MGISQQNLVKKWLVAQIKPNSYHIATQNLERQGFETFLPKMEITQRRKNQFVVKNVYVFPGYMFVRIKPDGAPWQKINSTLGVSRLICQDGAPKKVPTEVVSGLISRCDSLGRLLPPTAVHHGDTVEIHSGALANFIATVETIDSNRRIWVLMDIMGQTTRVQIAQEQLKLSN